MISLQFDNKDARVSTTVICDLASVPKILTWYGGYHAGDRYEAIIDGDAYEKPVKLVLDLNGELVGELPTA